MNLAKDKYRCGICETIYSAEDLEFSCQHSALGKYSVSPDPEDTECPFCGNRDMNAIYPMPKPEIVKPDASELTRMRKLWDAELALAEADAQRIRNESTSLMDTGDTHGLWETNRRERDRMRHGRTIGNLNAAQSNGIDALLRISEHEQTEPTHYPRTVEQNCLSGNITIKPQINWDDFDNEYGHLVRRM